MMAFCVVRLAEVQRVLVLAREPDRRWLLKRLKLYRAGMAFFVVGFVMVAVLCFFDKHMMYDPFVGVMCLAGGAFTNLGVLIQIRMSNAMAQTIGGLIPVCAWCKRVRNDSAGADGGGSWESMEIYLSRKTHSNITHGMCSDCKEKLIGEMAGESS